MNDQALVIEQYGSGDVVSRIEDALRHAGFAHGPVPREILAPLDQFHVGGAAATDVLASPLGIAPGARLLDVGCGHGGPSRHLAATYGCSVEGIDLSPAFVELAVMLTRRTGLSDKVSHVEGDATALPFEAESFDVAWTQHVAMNVKDRPAFYAGVHRVLRPGALFAMYDVVAGAGPLHFPVPWAREPAASFLLTPDATRAVLEACCFDVVEWTDATSMGVAWFQAQASTAQGRPEALRSLALPLIMGPDFPARTANLARNFQEGRAGLLQAIVRRR